MFSQKVYHFVGHRSNATFIRSVCVFRDGSSVAGLSRGKEKLVCGKFERRLRKSWSPAHRVSSATLSLTRRCSCICSSWFLSCKTDNAKQHFQGFHSLGNSNRLVTLPRQKMSETQKQVFRKKYQKRERRKLACGAEERKLDRNGKVSVQIIGSGTRDCPPSILLIGETVRFLFNCGEGTQRLLFENGLRSLAKLEHIFITRMTWENVGGATGMMITLKNVGLPKLSLYGPPELMEFSKATQIFAKHEAIDLDIKPYTEGPFLTDIMTVTPVPIYGNSDQSGMSPGSPLSLTPDPPSTPLSTNPDRPSTSDDINPTTAESPNPDTMVEALQETEGEIPDTSKKRKAKDPFDVISQMAVKQPNRAGPKRRKTEEIKDMTIAYICKLHDTPGRLDKQKAIDLGLKPGPEYGLLKAGKSVTTAQGREIRPEDVMEPATPGAVIIVLECPSEAFLDSVINNETIARYHTDNGKSIATLVFHICPENVINDPRYQSWMQRFGTSTEHIILNESCKTVTLEACRRIQTKLNLINQELFPLLPIEDKIDGENSNEERKDHVESSNIRKAESYLRYHLKPHTGWDREFVMSTSNKPFIEEAMALPGFSQKVEDLRSELMANQQGNTGPRYPELVLFGTGSAMPNKERNVTGILLNISESQSMLMDCGEGTFGQMYRFYGNGTNDILANLQSIFVSHMHADHHVGLIQILQQWRRVMLKRGETSKNLILVGPKRLLIWLNNYHTSCQPFIHHMKFIELQDLSWKADESPRHEASLLARLSLTHYETVPVPHCFNSHGLVIKHKDGWKLAYSGDSLPSTNLIRTGQDADVLIHEATFEDGLDDEALKKRHSMISQAINVGQKMGAKFTLLTHFSQRYPKIPYIDEQLSHKVGLAFDNMRVSFSALHQLPLCLPALQCLFTEYIQEMQELRDKRAEKNTMLSLDSILKSGKVVDEGETPITEETKTEETKTEDGQVSSL